MTNNPFILRGYVADEFFCDREQETVDLIGEVSNGNNVTLIAPRRVGKTGLILHTFNRPEVKARYYTFLIDLYATKNIEEMVQELGKSILNALKPHGTKVIQAFVNCLRSLRSSVSFDSNGTPSWSVEIGDIQTPDVTLDEIFRYLNSADRPCIVASTNSKPWPPIPKAMWRPCSAPTYNTATMPPSSLPAPNAT